MGQNVKLLWVKIFNVDVDVESIDESNLSIVIHTKLLRARTPPPVD